MSDAEQNLVAWMRGQGMHDSASLVERLTAERDALRAQLDAERETFVDAHGTTWLRPTAEAYYLVCKARDKHQSELAKERERADAHYRALENVTAKNGRLTAERDALRAELAAERGKRAEYARVVTETAAERDELRAVLLEVREDPDYRSLKGGLRARIDAALNKGGGDE